jgi:hypothetical protein
MQSVFHNLPRHLSYRWNQETNPLKILMEIVLLKVQILFTENLSFLIHLYCSYPMLFQVGELCISRDSAANCGGITHGSVFCFIYLFLLSPFFHTLTTYN